MFETSMLRKWNEILPSGGRRKQRLQSLRYRLQLSRLRLYVCRFLSLILRCTSQYTFMFAYLLPCHLLPGVQVDALTFGVCVNLEWSPFLCPSHIPLLFPTCSYQNPTFWKVLTVSQARISPTSGRNQQGCYQKYSETRQNLFITPTLRMYIMGLRSSVMMSLCCATERSVPYGSHSALAVLLQQATAEHYCL